jgi:MraZ protein
MSLFLGTHTNKVDRKGRVSLPAAFRDALQGEARKSVILFPSIRNHDALEGWRYSSLEQLNQQVAELALFSDESDGFAMGIFGDSHEAPIDADGRIILPGGLRETIGIEPEGGVTFVGAGDKFLVWHPARFEAQRAAMVEKARAQLRRGTSIALRGRRGGDDRSGGA